MHDETDHVVAHEGPNDLEHDHMVMIVAGIEARYWWTESEPGPPERVSEPGPP